MAAAFQPKLAKNAINVGEAGLRINLQIHPIHTASAFDSHMDQS
jgi:hypothetical protein